MDEADKGQVSTAAAEVYGVDINEGMLAVAARNAPELAWRRATVEALPFADGSFDRVACLFGLMFFEHTDIKGWTLADRIDDSQFQELLRGADADLGEFVYDDGTVVFDAPARFVTVEAPDVRP